MCLRLSLDSVTHLRVGHVGRVSSRSECVCFSVGQRVFFLFFLVFFQHLLDVPLLTLKVIVILTRSSFN